MFTDGNGERITEMTEEEFDAFCKKHGSPWRSMLIGFGVGMASYLILRFSGGLHWLIGQ